MRKQSRFEKDMTTALIALSRFILVFGAIAVFTGAWHHVFTLTLGIILTQALRKEKLTAI